MFQAVGDSTWVYVLACNQKDLHKICPNLWNFRTDHVQRSRVLHIFLTLKARAMSQRLRQVRTNRRPALWPIFFRKIVLYLFVPPSIFPYLSQGSAVYPSTSVEKTVPAWFLSVYLPRWLNLTKAVRTPFVTEGLWVFRSDFFFRFRWKPSILPCRIPHWYGPDLCPLDFHARFVRKIPGLQIRLKAGIWNIPDYRNI